MYSNPIGSNLRTDLDRFKKRDDDHPYNYYYEPASEIFFGPVSATQRRCTDIFWFILYILLVGIAVIYCLQMYQQVYIDRFFHQQDFRADLCGQQQLSDKPYLYLMDPIKIGKIGMCVDKCPPVQDLDYCFYDIDGKTILEDYCFKTYPTLVFQNQICMPKGVNPLRLEMNKIYNNYIEYWKQLAYDIYQVKDLIIGCVVLVVSCGFAYQILLLIKPLAIVFIWLSILIVPLMILLISFLFIDQEKTDVRQRHCQENDPDDICVGYQIFAITIFQYGILVASCLYLIILIKNYKSIYDMTQDMKIICKPLRQQKSIYLMPFLTSAAQIVATAIVIGMIVFLMSSGTAKDQIAPQDFPNPLYRNTILEDWKVYSIAALMALLLWLLQALYLFQKFTYCIAVEQWYFAREKSILTPPIGQSIFYGIFFHMGTFFKGAGIIILNWIFRSLMRYLKNFLQGLQDDNRESKFLRFMLIQCAICLKCFEHFQKYQSHNAMMHVALFGEPFNASTEKTFYIMQRNDTRSLRFGPILGYVRLIGALFSTIFGVVYIYNQVVILKQTTDGSFVGLINFPFALAILCFALGFYLPQNFTTIYDTVVECMLYCLLADEEMFMGRERFCDPEILEYFNTIGKEKERKGLNAKISKKGNTDAYGNKNGDDDLRIRAQERPKTPPEDDNKNKIEEEEEEEEEEEVQEDVNAVDLFANADRLGEKDRVGKQDDESDKNSHTSEIKIKGITAGDIGGNQSSEEEEEKQEQDLEYQKELQKIKGQKKAEFIGKSDDIILDRAKKREKQQKEEEEEDEEEEENDAEEEDEEEEGEEEENSDVENTKQKKRR